jgi:flagellar biosynthesis/type III secretory pathway protein FliH
MLIATEEQEERGFQEGGDSLSIQSQADYIPTPFNETSWEVVGTRLEVVQFVSMDVEVIPSEMTKADPMFADFGGGVEAGQVFSTGKRILEEEAEPEIDEEMLEAIRQDAFEQGRLQGLEDGKAEALAENQIALDELSKDLKQFQLQLVREVKSVCAKTEKGGFELALAISNKILKLTAEVRPEYILEIIRGALESTGAGKPLKVRVSPQDMEFLEVIGLPPDLSSEETGVSYVADEAITSGCVVETDFGEVDHRLDSMWEQVKENLFDVAK